MGDNGAGKSTLMKIVAGNFPPSAGDIIMDGDQVTFAKPIDARRRGIEIVYQDLALCDNLTAAANVFLGREIRRRIGPIRYLDHAAMNKKAGELFAELKSETRPRDLVRQMSGGQRQAVAIARTRLSDPETGADGRAYGGDLRASGGGGSRPHSPPQGYQPRGGVGFSPDARRLLRSVTG